LHSDKQTHTDTQTDSGKNNTSNASMAGAKVGSPTLSSPWCQLAWLYISCYYLKV